MADLKWHRGWEKSRTTLRQLAQENCVSFKTTGDMGGLGSVVGEGPWVPCCFYCNQGTLGSTRRWVSISGQFRSSAEPSGLKYRFQISKQVEVEGYELCYPRTLYRAGVLWGCGRKELPRSFPTWKMSESWRKRQACPCYMWGSSFKHVRILESVPCPPQGWRV